MWQNVSIGELASLLLSTLLMLAAIILAALLIIVTFKGIVKITELITGK